MVGLVAGLADEMEARGLAVLGPTRRAARIEGSKSWARQLCRRYGIPAPESAEFDDLDTALQYLDGLEPPYVIKADGLAAGKGVTVAEDRQAAEGALLNCLIDRIFGEAGLTVLIEEYLEGWEVSAMALTDGRRVLPLALAHDYKRALDGDQGPNTGGMGAFSPLPSYGPEGEARIARTVLEPAVRALEEEGILYRGVLYAGLMVTAQGPKVLEFNCRFGDLETKVVLPRLQSNLGEALLACVEGNLSAYELAWTKQACVGVVLASAGYPGSHESGKTIEGLAGAAAVRGVRVFHAGTAERDGRVVTAGGRVLSVTGIGPDLQTARERAYEGCALVRFDGKAYRGDIALDEGPIE